MQPRRRPAGRASAPARHRRRAGRRGARGSRGAHAEPRPEHGRLPVCRRTHRAAVALLEERARGALDVLVPSHGAVERGSARRPTTRSGRSQANAATPAASMSTKRPTPRNAACASPGSTGAPARIAGRLSSGSARTVTRRGAPETLGKLQTRCRPLGIPTRASIRYWSAPAAAAPPGMILLSAFPASWESATGSRWGACRAILCSSQTAKKDSVSTAKAIATQTGSSSNSSRQEVNTSSRLGRRM